MSDHMNQILGKYRIMERKLEELKKKLTTYSAPGATENSPPWLAQILNNVPGLPADAVPHGKPNHADLQGAIADGSFHPAIEACLHLINGDLYSAHFLVRKAQGGSRYLDWLHAVLHKLEGDFRNAKMWYTDLGNNNAGALDGNGDGAVSESKAGKVGIFRRFHAFWFVCGANGGSGERVAAKDLKLDSPHGVPCEVRLTAHQHTDLVFLSSLASKATGSAAATPEPMRREVERHHSSTTLSEGKIKNSESAFSLEELRFVCDHLSDDDGSRNTVRCLTMLELLWMLEVLVNDFGWRRYDLVETMEALKMESTPAHENVDQERKSKASNMVFEPGKGQRKF